jgi:hypothetical protein
VTELPLLVRIQAYLGATMVVIGFAGLALNVLGGTLMMVGGGVMLLGSRRAARRLGGRR